MTDQKIKTQRAGAAQNALSARQDLPQVKSELVRMTKRGIITTNESDCLCCRFILALVVGALMLLAIGKTRSLLPRRSSGHSARRLPQLKLFDRGSLAIATLSVSPLR